MADRPDPLARDAVVVTLTLPDGSELSRGWPMLEAPAAFAPPPWLKNGRRAWDRPQDPITFTGSVRAGHEDEARAWLEALGR